MAPSVGGSPNSADPSLASLTANILNLVYCKTGDFQIMRQKNPGDVPKARECIFRISNYCNITLVIELVLHARSLIPGQQFLCPQGKECSLKTVLHGIGS